jgi:hypothetical protein
MAYNKAQLIAAYCEARGITVAEIPAEEVKIQARIDRDIAKWQERIDNIPATAKQAMKQVALDHLNNKANEQVIEDNAGVSL